MRRLELALHRVARNWNIHRFDLQIMQNPLQTVPMFFISIPTETLGSQDYLIPVDIDERQIAKKMCCTDQPSLWGCCDEFNALADYDYGRLIRNAC